MVGIPCSLSVLPVRRCTSARRILLETGTLPAARPVRSHDSGATH